MDKDKVKKESIKLEFDLVNTEIIERSVCKFGTGAHVIVPKEYSGKKVKIIFLDHVDNEKEGKINVR